MPRYWLIAVLVLLLTLACGGGAETLQLTEADNLGQFSVDSGDTVEVTLEENSSTRYMWNPVVIPEMLTLDSDEYFEPDSDLVGAPGSHVFVLEASEKGAGIVRLEYIRPFDDPIVPQRVVEYIVIVDDAQWPSKGPDRAPLPRPRHRRPPGHRLREPVSLFVHASSEDEHCQAEDDDGVASNPVEVGGDGGEPCTVDHHVSHGIQGMGEGEDVPDGLQHTSDGL